MYLTQYISECEKLHIFLIVLSCYFGPRAQLCSAPCSQHNAEIRTRTTAHDLKDEEKQQQGQGGSRRQGACVLSKVRWMCGRILEYMDGWMIEEDSSTLKKLRLLQVEEASRINQIIQKHVLDQYRHSLSWASIRENLAKGTPLFAALVAPVSTVRTSHCADDMHCTDIAVSC